MIKGNVTCIAYRVDKSSRGVVVYTDGGQVLLFDNVPFDVFQSFTTYSDLTIFVEKVLLGNYNHSSTVWIRK